MSINLLIESPTFQIILGLNLLKAKHPRRHDLDQPFDKQKNNLGTGNPNNRVSFLNSMVIFN